jgi:hypothetical protein
VGKDSVYDLVELEIERLIFGNVHVVGKVCQLFEEGYNTASQSSLISDDLSTQNNLKI